MQNRNHGGFEVATAFNNDTPLMGPKEMVRVQSESLTMITDVVNWRKIVWQLEQVCVGIEAGLDEMQLEQLINNKLEPDRMAKIISIAVMSKQRM